MKRNISIKLKAGFLLTAFALNTVIGFACAVGINMRFNSHHHDKADRQESKESKGNCCNDKVIKFEQVDKAPPQPSSTAINPELVTTFFSSYCNIDILYPSLVTASVKYFTRNYHPPIPDIRIAIQSFQI